MFKIGTNTTKVEKFYIDKTKGVLIPGWYGNGEWAIGSEIISNLDSIEIIKADYDIIQLIYYSLYNRGYQLLNGEALIYKI